VYGVDTTVLEMQIEDGFKEATSSCAEHEYLQRCHQQLMDKVRAYRVELERERLEKI
jgi:ABC-type phosphate transport system auxiliary subunit